MLDWLLLQISEAVSSLVTVRDRSENKMFTICSFLPGTMWSR